MSDLNCGDFKKYSQVSVFNNINEPAAISRLKAISPDIVIVVGTRKLSKIFLNEINCIIVNLHGGDSSKYRGLDSHFWALYHKDFDSFDICLHHVTNELDAGDIIQKEKMVIQASSKIEHLRLINTECALNMTKRFLSDLCAKKHLKNYPQESKGRYYSFMPSCLKEIAIDNFNRFCLSLK